MREINIAIDGFSGCGKSSTAKEVAKRLEYRFINSGAMYRAVTLYFIQNEVDFSDAGQVEQALEKIKIDFQFNPELQRAEIYLNGENIEPEIQKMYVSELVSPVSAIKAVRVAMVAQQQEMAKSKGVIMEGRDIGSVVLPNAELKIFMTATDQARAIRRHLELKEKGEDVPVEEIAENFRARDLQDSTRKESPLIKVEDAIEIDTSDLEFEDQVQQVLNLAQQTIDAVRG